MSNHQRQFLFLLQIFKKPLGLIFFCIRHRHSELNTLWAHSGLLIGCFAIHNDTEIRITPPIDHALTFNNRTYKQDEVVVVTINRFQLEQIHGLDVTGSFVRNLNKPVAVIIGHEHVAVHGNREIAVGSDMLMAQMPPVATLSNVYPVAATLNNDEELIRVFAVHNNTAFSIYRP
ncbi:unnamed protein product [Mytilus edulis]|uniref:IgGFc-binding protein N-terminal domain-containing protein n=1 Tax=Mytilus edulis TaxID=6550 RepID=A0A8S3T2W9_MYTED|nr:unnamed protein product [Mytilus edulis]